MSNDEDHVGVNVRTYDAIAENYSVTATPELRAWKENSMRRFAEMLPGRRVLVAACGDGRDSRFLARLGLSVVSFDLSDGMLAQARQHDPDGVYLKRDLRDFTALPGPFDGIWASGCLYHLTKRELATWLKEAREALAERGVLYLSMKEGSGERFEDVPGSNYPGGEKAKTLLRGKRFYAYYSREELLSLLKIFTLVSEQRAPFGERNFEFWVQRERSDGHG